jgi:hypothetical protein
MLQAISGYKAKKDFETMLGATEKTGFTSVTLSLKKGFVWFFILMEVQLPGKHIYDLWLQSRP